MKYTYRILPILTACLVLILTPLLAATGQPEYPNNFLSLNIPQLPGSKVVEVRRSDKVPVAVVLESENTNRVAASQFYDRLRFIPPFKDAWYYDLESMDNLQKIRFLEGAGDTDTLVYVNDLSGKILFIKISPKGSKGSRVELTYPWEDPAGDWFKKLLEEGVDPKQPHKK